VDQQAVSQAKEQYQDELLDMEENEQQKEAQAEASEEKAKRVALHRAASMKGMDELFEDLMVKGDGDMARLKGLQQLEEPKAQLRDQVDSASEEYVQTVLAHKATKDGELADFTGALEHAKAEASAEMKREIATYNALAKRSLGAESSEQTYAMIQQLHKANEALYERLMDLEVSSSERYAESISAFESAYDELTKKTIEQTGIFFGKLRDLEAAYHERLVAGAAELLEKVAADQGDNLPEDARSMLSDKDTTMGALNTAHDARVARLDAKEDELRTMENGSNASIIQSTVDAEYHRNRTAVIEVWNLCHVVNRNELRSDRFDE